MILSCCVKRKHSRAPLHSAAHLQVIPELICSQHCKVVVSPHTHLLSRFMSLVSAGVRMRMKLDTFIQCCINKGVKNNASTLKHLSLSLCLSLSDTHTHTLFSSFSEELLLLLMGALNCQFAREMTPAAETSQLVIHCFNHSGSPTSYQPWQGLTHHCLLRALAPFVLFRTLSLPL